MTKRFLKSKPMMVMALALVMVLCLSFGAFAKEYDSSYIQSASTSTSEAIDVTVTVEGVSIPYTEIPVSLTAKSNDTQKVLDAMLAINNLGGNVYFQEDDVNPINDETKYFTHIMWYEGENYVLETGNGTGYSGWCFRINGGIPKENAIKGASIDTATITDGDVISFYIDNPIATTSAAKFTRTNGVSYANGTVNAVVTESNQYFGPAPDYVWHISSFAALKDVTVKVFDAKGDEKGTGTTKADGTVSISTGNLAPGTYTVKAIGTKDYANITKTTSTAALVVK